MISKKHSSDATSNTTDKRPRPAFEAKPKDHRRLPQGLVWAKVSPARKAAFQILMGVGNGDGHSDELLHQPHIDALSTEDKNLTTALVMGVLRWQIALDARIQPLLQRPGQRLADAVAVALRLGAFQLQYMERIPAHAALSESVEICKAAGEEYAAGMVNAVLRKLSGMPPASAKIYETVDVFAERLGHPGWMVERWAKQYGRDIAKKICEADQQEPQEGTMFAAKEDDLPIMDDGSRLIAEIAVAAQPSASHVWDVCAAPGGKTLVMAKRLPDAALLATDVSKKRLTHMQTRLRRYSYADKVVVQTVDATQPAAVNGEFDLILCDVPCSGTGTLSRNPEIRHRLDVQEISRQAARQREILASALRRLIRGGRLVYSTCSLEPEECEDVVDAVLRRMKPVRRVPIESVLASAGLATGIKPETMVRNGALRTLPGIHPGDGFFAVVLEL